MSSSASTAPLPPSSAAWFRRARLERESRSPIAMASLYVQAGEPERAIEQLQKGCEDRDFFMIFVLAEPTLAPLRSDPRFVTVARRVGVM